MRNRILCRATNCFVSFGEVIINMFYSPTTHELDNVSMCAEAREALNIDWRVRVQFFTSIQRAVMACHYDVEVWRHIDG
jgi:hypothetical protein